MKNLGYSLELLDGSYGFSCIENYFIAFLRHKGYPFQALFLNSHLDDTKTIYNFIEKRLAYTDFMDVECISSVADRMGAGSLEHRTGLDTAEMIDILNESLSIGNPLLIRINKDSLSDGGNVVPWLDNHFVCVYGADRERVYLLDDVPRRLLTLNWTELEDVFSRNVQICRYEGALHVDTYFREECLSVRYHEPSMTERRQLLERIKHIEPDELICCRDAIGCIRISARRLAAWSLWAFGVTGEEKYHRLYHLFPSHNATLDILFGRLEMYRLRSCYDGAKLSAQMEASLEAGDALTKALIETHWDW